jgi:tetratricopeptide (TPR) repeat protein
MLRVGEAKQVITRGQRFEIAKTAKLVIRPVEDASFMFYFMSDCPRSFLTLSVFKSSDMQDCAPSAEPDLAIRACTKSIEKFSSESWAYARRAAAFHRKGDLEHAINDYSRAIELDPKGADALIDRAAAYSDRGDHERAISELDRILAMDGQQTILSQHGKINAHNNRAWICYLAGKASDGLQDAELAVALDPTRADVRDTRGHIYESLGRKAEAIADYQTALSIDPTSEPSKEGLKRLGLSP